MSKLKKNNFLFIILISVITLVILVVGAFSLYEDNSSVFASDGYILETSTKTNKKYYFSANTKYKENVDRDISFKDKESNTVAVNPASFVHYTNGSVAFLKKGALVNLADITSPMVSYYNINDDNLIVKDNNVYTVTSNNKKINISSFVGRISDDKYLIAGDNLSVKVPKVEERVNGDYFEILFIEEGIVKIDNKDNSYQVTAQDSYVYVGDNITISLGDGKIYHETEAKMLMSQITINNDENINLDVYDKDGAGGSGGDGSGGTGEGGGSGEGEGEGDGDGTGEDGEGESTLGEIEGSGGEGAGGSGGDGTGEGEGGSGGGAGGTGDGKGDGKGEGSGGGSGGGGNATDSTNSLKIELIEAEVTATSINLTMQLNNASMAKGNVVATLTNVENGQIERRDIALNNGTFKLSFDALWPYSDYTFSIVETAIGGGTQYFQKNFRTEEFGITLEKVYATDSSLAYSVIFDENTDVNKVQVSINYDKATPKKEVIVTKDQVKNLFEFGGLASNTTYSVTVDKVWINNALYNGVYTINRLDTTLKTEPKISDIEVKSNEEEVKFTIKLNEIVDDDDSIISYTYNIYRVEDITADNLEPEPVIPPIVKYDSDPLVLDLSEIKELKTSVNYKCKVFAQYFDNEMEREVSTPDYSEPFLIKSRPTIEFEEKEVDINKVTGTIKLVDANGVVPLRGNNFILRYYKATEAEDNKNDVNFNFKSDSTYDVAIGEKENALGEIVGTLASNTMYAVKVYGNYYGDKDNDGDGQPDLLNGQIGDTFYITTDKSGNIYFERLGDNKSNNTNIVNFNARLNASNDSEIDAIDTITFKLYKGRDNKEENLIGIYKVTDKSDIKNLFSNTIITNSLFTDVTKNKLGLINDLNKLITVTGSLDKSLLNAYTVEVTDVYDLDSNEKKYIENSIQTFNLTSSYFLDARIASNKGPYVTYKPIYKKDLTEEEYEELLKDVDNLDLLNNDTVVGIKLENSLAYNHVNDSFENFEKVVVDYVICNDTIKACDDIINEIVDLGNRVAKDDDEKEEINKAIEKAKKQVKIISFNMDDWYRTETQTIWLDSSELEDGKGGHFTRGYNYRVGYNLNFYTKDGSNPVYTNKALYVNTLKTIPRQNPIYTQYISSSNSKGITYRYSFSDVDKAINDKNFYYILDGSEDYISINKSLSVDGNEHEVTIPLTSNTKYSLCYATKNFDDKAEYKSISTYDFETEYNYNEKVAYTIDKNLKNNVLRLKLEDNDVNNRGQVYKVVIKSKDSSKNIPDYTRYFIASQFATMDVPTGNVDAEGNEISIRYKYIDIDYANISKFIGVDMLVEVYSYYNSGLVGVDQNFDNGMILYNYTDNKYLNIYSGGSDVSQSEVKEQNYNMGIYYLKENYKYGNSNMYIYNKLLLLEKNAEKTEVVYIPLKGASYFSDNSSNLGSNIGINFGFSVNKETIDETVKSRGLLLINPNDEKGYSNYTPVVLKEAKLITKDNSYKFDSIVPSIDVTTNKGNTINSVHIEINPTGIYSDKHFKKDGNVYKKVEVDVYDDEELKNKVKTLYSDINIAKDGDTGYSATINAIDYKDLKSDTTYYFKVYAYVDNDRVQLYDSSVKTAYVAKTYNISTLSAKEIYQSFKFDVEPIGYSSDGSSKKLLTWRIGLLNTLNYKLRFELFEPDVNDSTLFKEVRFDGVSDNFDKCDINVNGTSSDNYVTNNGCYISIPKEDIKTINNKEKTYEFSGDNFIFGGNYYKIIVRAIPYTNGKYVEDDSLILYQNDSLTSSQPNANNSFAAISIPTISLDEPKVGMGDLFGGYKCNKWEYNSKDRNMVCLDSDQYYFVSYTGSINDKFKVIRNGKYTISLLNENLEKLDSCRYFVNFDDKSDDNKAKTINSGGCSVNMNVDDVNQNVRFADLNSNAMYYIEISYNVFRNNIGFSDIEKTQVIPYTEFVYTPMGNNTLGNINAGQATTKSVTLTYNGAANLTEKITKIEYTIRSKGINSSSISGEYIIGKDKSFEYAADKTPRLTININDSSFMFRENESYIINTIYHYEVCNNDTCITDVVIDPYTLKSTFTTSLDL